MTAEWIKIISEYGAIAVLTIIFILFARGMIVSRKTADMLQKGFRESLDMIQKTFEKANKDIQETFEKSIKNMCNTFETSVKLRNIAFVEELKTIKHVVEILKKRNGIK